MQGRFGSSFINNSSKLPTLHLYTTDRIQNEYQAISLIIHDSLHSLLVPSLLMHPVQALHHLPLNTRHNFFCSWTFCLESIMNGQCIVNLCLNGGTCSAYMNTYRCHCPDGFQGKHCEGKKKKTCHFWEYFDGSSKRITSKVLVYKGIALYWILWLLLTLSMTSSSFALDC